MRKILLACLAETRDGRKEKMVAPGREDDLKKGLECLECLEREWTGKKEELNHTDNNSKWWLLMLMLMVVGIREKDG